MLGAQQLAEHRVLGSVLLLCSASAGFLLASRVERLGARRLSRAGLLLTAAGYGTAAATTVLPLVVAGAAVGGFGSGTTMTVAAGRIAARRDPHRASTLGLLAVFGLMAAIIARIVSISRRQLAPRLAAAVPVPAALAGACAAFAATAFTHEVLHYRWLWTLLGIIAAVHLLKESTIHEPASVAGSTALVRRSSPADAPPRDR